MESATLIWTISEVAQVLRCSKAHVHKALSGRIAGVPQLAHLSLGRKLAQGTRSTSGSKRAARKPRASSLPMWRESMGTAESVEMAGTAQGSDAAEAPERGSWRAR